MLLLLDYCIQPFTVNMFFSVHVVFLNMFCIIYQKIREKSVHFSSLIDFLETKYMFHRNWYFFLRNIRWPRGVTISFPIFLISFQNLILFSFQNFCFPSKLFGFLLKFLVSFQNFWFPSKIFVLLLKFLFSFQNLYFGFLPKFLVFF